MSFDVAPPLTRTERWAIVLMAGAAILGGLLVAAVTEYETRRAAASWPPRATPERTEK